MVLFLQILGHCIYCALRHPRSQIIQMANPTPIEQSPIPWWGSIFVLIIGIVVWCVSVKFGISGLDEAGRAMVYLPLGNIFGMTLVTIKPVRNGNH